MGKEIWQDIPGFPGYRASSLGRIKSIARRVKYTGGVDRALAGRILKIHWRKRDGYGRVDVCLDGRRIPIPVHCAVAAAFNGPKPAGSEVRHKDGVKRNNRPSNLLYGTRADNEADKIGHGTSNRGDRCGTSKLTTKQIKSIRASKEGSRELGERHGVSARHIRKIRSGDRWGWL